MNQLLFWVAFNAFVLTMLILDLAVFHRKSHTVKLKEALGWTAFWIFLAALFAAGVYFWKGRNTALEFVTGYIVEEALSIDNLFVFLVIFKYFKVPDVYQHKVLFWGIVGALVMRGIFIFLGVSLIQRFHWIIYVFGAFLIYTGARLLRSEESEVNLESNLILRWIRSWLPVTSNYEGDRFVVRKEKIYATPLLLVLLVVESTDVVFAADSIPAILAITRDAFIVYTSNVFAILGLRSLYFALAGIIKIFHYLHYGLAFVLMFIGAKMLLSARYEIPIGIALGVVAGVLALSVIASLVFPNKVQEAA